MHFSERMCLSELEMRKRDLLLSLQWVGERVGLSGCDWTLRFRDSGTGMPSRMLDAEPGQRRSGAGGEDRGDAGTEWPAKK